MKSLRIMIVAALIATCSLAAQAQLKFGLKAGMNVNSLHFNESTFDADNRAGFNGGVMLEFTAPLIGIGFDLSAMYVYRSAQFMENNQIEKNNRSYFEIPLNLKYKLNVPAINHIVRPFITTGPSVAFLAGKEEINQAFKNNTVDWAWNFGLGLEIVSHVQVAASYGLGLTKAIEAVDKAATLTSIEGKNRYWTITVAYLF